MEFESKFGVAFCMGHKLCGGGQQQDDDAQICPKGNVTTWFFDATWFVVIDLVTPF